MVGKLQTFTIGIALGLIAPSSIVRAEPPTSQPSAQSAETTRRLPPGAMIERLQNNLAKLDLSADQKQKIQTVLDNVKKQLQQAHNDIQTSGDRQAAMQKIRDTLADSRQQLAGILSADQLDKLRQFMQQEPERPTANVDQKPPAPPGENKMAGDTMMTDKSSGSSGASAKPQAAVASIAVGQPAPDFARKTLDGKLVQPSAMKGRVIVLVFGSYSTPTFRDRAASLDKLASQYGTKANFYVVYTREAHAAGEWEVQRNKDEKISVQQAKTDADRTAEAEQTVKSLRLSVPVIVDGMDDSIASAYGLAPNGAVIIGRNGEVFAKQHWFEPIGLAEQLDAAVAARNQ